MSIRHDGIGLWMGSARKPLGLSVTVDLADGNTGDRFEVAIPWKDLLPFRDDIQRGLHDDIAGALRERFIEIIDKARKEIEEA